MQRRDEPPYIVVSTETRPRYGLAFVAAALLLVASLLLLALHRAGVVHSPLCAHAGPVRIDLLRRDQAPPGTRRRLPHCLIVGVRKGGTRALLEFLDLHPSIVAAPEEVHFFDQQWWRGLRWYRHRMPFSTPNQITLEKSPAYFITDGVPERVQTMNASILLLLIVRDPVQRAISDYAQLLANRRVRDKPMAPFQSFALDAAGHVNAHYKPIRTSMYARHLARWLRVFPRRQVYVVDGDRLTKEPLTELARVERFLGVESRLSDRNVYFNETRGFYCMRTEMGKERCLSESKGRPHPSVPPEVVATLSRFFAPHNERFYRLVGRRFDWR